MWCDMQENNGKEHGSGNQITHCYRCTICASYLAPWDSVSYLQNGSDNSNYFMLCIVTISQA